MKEIFTRRSIRKYDLSKKLNHDELVDITKAGFAAPTARNQRSRNFLIVDDESIIAELSEVSKGSMILKNCNTVIAILGYLDDSICMPEMQCCDLSAAQENMMIYARSKNLGTCWIGVYPIEERIKALKKILNVPSNMFVFSLMAIGYPENESCFKEVDKFDETKVFYNRF